MEHETMTIHDVIRTLQDIENDVGPDTPAMMLPQENDEPYPITAVNLGYDDFGQQVANFTTD